MTLCTEAHRHIREPRFISSAFIAFEGRYQGPGGDNKALLDRQTGIGGIVHEQAKRCEGIGALSAREGGGNPLAVQEEFGRGVEQRGSGAHRKGVAEHQGVEPDAVADEAWLSERAAVRVTGQDDLDGEMSLRDDVFYVAHALARCNSAPDDERHLHLHQHLPRGLQRGAGVLDA